MKFVVRIRCEIPKSLQEAVLKDLIPQIPALEDGTAYHLRGDNVEYWVERGGTNIYVDVASPVWDIYEVQAP